MTRSVIVRPEAKRDLREAKTWYGNISAELKADFVKKVDNAVALARERPLAYQIVLRTFRRVLIQRFPYALFFHADEDRIVVVAVLHQARDPELLDARR